MPEEDPYWIHHCDTCIFLGSCEDPTDERAETYDLYYHPPTNNLPQSDTVVARWSSDGDGYVSGFNFVDAVPPLAEAVERANLLGLLPCPIVT